MSFQDYELEDAKKDLQTIAEAYDNLKRFLQQNKDCPAVRWEALKAYNFGHIEPYLFIDHDYVCRERSLEQVLEDMSEYVVSDDDDDDDDDDDYEEYTEGEDDVTIWVVSPELTHESLSDEEYLTECAKLEDAYTRAEILTDAPYNVYVKAHMSGMAPGVYMRNDDRGDFQILGYSVEVPADLKILSDKAWELYCSPPSKGNNNV